MVTLTKIEKLQKEEKCKPFKPLLDELLQCSTQEFVSKLVNIVEWDRSRDDLFIWIPILNRIDEILNKMIETYSYKFVDLTNQPVKLVEMSPTDENTAVDLISFTCRLLNNTCNRSIYSSIDVMDHMLNCPSFKVKAVAMKVIAIMAERHVTARHRVESNSFTPSEELKEKALALALCLPSSATDDKMEHFSLVDLFFEKKRYPSKWKTLDFTYYTSHSKEQNPTSRASAVVAKPTSNTSALLMKHFTLTTDELKSLSLQQIFDKGMAEIPSQNWFQFCLHATVSKAFSEDTFENIQLRNSIIQVKFNAVAFTSAIYIPAQISTKLFEVDPYTFNSLTEFISLSETKLPRDLRTDALFALECISSKHIWCSDIVRNLGGNMSHGLLFQILRYIAKIIQEDIQTEVDEEYNVRLFYLISNLADVKSLQESLLSAGLISSLLEIVSVKHSRYKRTLASATHLLEVIVGDSDATTEFIANNGFKILIESVNDEVNFALEHPEFGEPSKYSVVYYSISFRQLGYIRSLLKLVLKLLKTDSGDRIRNLIDSPILLALNKLLENRKVFGYTLITYALDVVQTIINTEPTIYQVLVESGTIPYILEHFDQFMGPSSELLRLLPEVISALCLNNDGLHQVKEKKLVKYIFDIILTPELSKTMVWEDRAVDIGISIDELARHYPDLKPIIKDAFFETVKKIPQCTKFTHPYLYRSPSGKGEFYHSKDDEVIDYEEGAGEIAFWETQESAPIINCFSDVFCGMTLENESWADLLDKTGFCELVRIVLDRPTFDYVNSSSFLNFTDALNFNCKHSKDSDHVLPCLLEILKENMEEITDFLTYDFGKSYILSETPEKIEKLVHKLCVIGVLLYLIVELYIEICTMSPSKVLQVLDFENGGPEVIKNVGLLFQRSVLEEMYIRQNLPNSVAIETTVQAFNNAPPIIVQAAKPAKTELKDDKTSAKFKNTLQERTIFIKLQSWIALLFRRFTRLTHSRKISAVNSDRALEVRIFDSVVKEITAMIDLRYLESHLSYFLVVFHFNAFVLTYPNSSSSASGKIQTIPALLFYQNGGYKLYFEAIKLLFKKIQKIKDVESIEKIDYVKDSEDIMAVSTLINALSFFNKSIQFEMMENIRNANEYYPYDDIFYNVTKALIVPIKILALGLLDEIMQVPDVFGSDVRRLPYSVFKQILSMLKNIYNSSSEEIDQGLYELRWDLMPPSHRKIQLLVACGITPDVAQGYLEEQNDDLPIHVRPDVFSEEEWGKYQEIKKAGECETDVQLLAPQYKDYSTSDDLSVMRTDFYRNNLEDKILEVLPLYPKLVNAISRTFLEIFNEVGEARNKILVKLLKILTQIELEDTFKLAPVIHLFGIFLNDSDIYEQAEEEIKQFLEYLVKCLRPNNVNKPWFSKALYVYEIILAKSEAPKIGEIPEGIDAPCPAVFSGFKIPVDIKQTIFDVLIRVNEITDFYSALAISRILILYTRDEHFSYEVSQSSILSKILKVIGFHQKLDKINYLESSFLLLARRCFENSDVVSNLIQYELNEAFTTRVANEYKEKSRELSGLVSEKANIVMRDPDLFVNSLCETARFGDFASPEKLENLGVKRYMQEKDEDMNDLDSTVDGRHALKNRTGIIHLLLSQLMAAYKKDWTSEPPVVEDADKKKGNSGIKVSRNPVCAYMIFLLKVLIELVISYKQSKFEFLTFNKRNMYVESPKPRMTALNFFLYQLLDTKGPNQSKHETKRREVVGRLACDVIIGFTSSVQHKCTQKQDPKLADPDMTFIRKFTIECLTKALKDTTSSHKSLQMFVGKLYGWFDLTSSLLLTERSYLHAILDTDTAHPDKYQICKLMLEMNVPSIIADCVASLDLNYPFSKKLFNCSIEPLNAINKIRNEFSELFKLENNEEDEEVDDESDKEDVQDMFKNSALGMYDVEDIEDYDDDEDESLMGDDEDIAFVEEDEDGIEVVFSETEREHETGDYSGSSDDTGSEDASGDDIGFEIEGDNVVVNIAHESDDEASDTDGSNEAASSDNSELSYYTNSGSSVDLIEVDDNGYDSELGIDLDDPELGASDWESGLSELSDSDSSDSDVEDVYDYSVRSGGRWLRNDGIEIDDYSEDDDERGRFTGIQHVFSPEEELFRSYGERSRNGHGFNHRDGRHSGFSIMSHSVNFLNGERRNQSTLTNPLGPSGLEEVENGIVNQSSNISTGVNYRAQPMHLSDLLLQNAIFGVSPTESIVLKSTTARWNDILEMFYDSKVYANNVIPTIVGRIFQASYDLYVKRREETREKEREQKMKREEELRKQMEARKRTLEEMQSGDEDQGSDASETVEQDNLEPIYVNIDGEEVNIAGTDIDPDFLNELPEDMRAEVFAEHVRERRAEAIHHTVHSREIDSDFLDAIPENIREEILDQEAAESRFSQVIGSIREQTDTDVNPGAGEVSITEGDVESETKSANNDNEKKKVPRIHFAPLVDRSGIAALMKSVFICQPYLAREVYHELFYRLCSSKQNRSDIMNMLLLILTEGINDQHSLERIYNLISNRASGNVKHVQNYQLPVDCTPLIVANQSIEILQSLIDADSRLKFFFVTEHENLLINKSPSKKRDIFSKNMKWPINCLFSLLDKNIITDETVLMDLLTRILQVCTKPISTIVKTSKDSTKKKFQVPHIQPKHLEHIVSIIKLESCNTKVFQQTLNIMTNISMLKGVQDMFTKELSALAIETVNTLVKYLDALSAEILTVKNGTEINSEIIQKFTVPSSEQSKLLKVLTAIDYMYTTKKNAEEVDVQKLMDLYNKMTLGSVWVALSKCLSDFEDRQHMSTSATILLPLIESLMVVCKHSKVRDTKDPNLKYESKKCDFAQIPVENLFFSFTDLHKKLLNQMIRSNPKLMSGPFSLLVKNPKILDFDNKRYYFIAELRSDNQDRPKLSITIRREQVFLDSYRSLFFKSNNEIKNSKLEITFKGEAGVDAGGVTREWYQVLSRQMFNPDYALFLPVASDKTTFHPNRTSGINPEHLSFFKFIGMIIGKAINDQCFLDCHFSRDVYKNMLGKPVSLKDMESLDLDYYKSLIWILENDITDIIEETFSVETDDYGEHKTIDLIENGHNVPVTEENKQDYVKKIVEYKLHTSVKDQIDNFLQGFYAIIPKDLISIFDEQELELLISGLPDIDVDDWKNNTTYGNYTPTCKQINYFWRAVRSFDAEERAKLLQFVTGTSKVPLNGFKELTGVNGVSKFSIHRDYGPTDRLPSSHTCFNQLDLPAYNSYETLRGSLLLAINEGHEGFGIA